MRTKLNALAFALIAILLPVAFNQCADTTQIDSDNQSSLSTDFIFALQAKPVVVGVANPLIVWGAKGALTYQVIPVNAGTIDSVSQKFTPAITGKDFQIKATDSSGRVAIENFDVIASSVPSLSLSSASSEVDVGALVNFTVTGGSGSYAVTRDASSVGDGYINKTGTNTYSFQGTRSGVMNFKATDVSGTANPGYLTIFVKDFLTIGTSKEDLFQGQMASINVTGGNPSYNVQIVGTAKGTLTTVSNTLYTYTAGVGPYVETIRVTDSDGTVKNVTINVLASLVLASAKAQLNYGEQVALTVTGGKSPYQQIRLVSGGGSISGSTYTACTSPTCSGPVTAVLSVTDATGAIASLNIAVVPPLVAMTPVTFSAATAGAGAPIPANAVMIKVAVWGGGGGGGGSNVATTKGNGASGGGGGYIECMIPVTGGETLTVAVGSGGGGGAVGCTNCGSPVANYTGGKGGGGGGYSGVFRGSTPLAIAGGGGGGGGGGGISTVPLNGGAGGAGGSNTGLAGVATQATLALGGLGGSQSLTSNGGAGARAGFSGDFLVGGAGAAGAATGNNGGAGGTNGGGAGARSAYQSGITAGGDVGGSGGGGGGYFGGGGGGGVAANNAKKFGGAGGGGGSNYCTTIAGSSIVKNLAGAGVNSGLVSGTIGQGGAGSTTTTGASGASGQVVITPYRY